MVIHVDCNGLTKEAKEDFSFDTSRYCGRRSRTQSIIESIIEHIKSDTKLEELNNKAAEEMEDEETVSVEDLQKDVSLFIEATGGLIRNTWHDS